MLNSACSVNQNGLQIMQYFERIQRISDVVPGLLSILFVGPHIFYIFKQPLDLFFKCFTDFLR